MSKLSPDEKRVLSQYKKAVFHLRAQYRNNGRLSLVLGSGVSSDFGIPTWKTLVDRIAGDPAIDGGEVLNAAKARNLSTTIVTQMLYERLRENLHRKQAAKGANTPNSVERAFRMVVHRALYRGNAGKVLEHPYLEKFLPIVRNSDLTITYNFDDCLERFLLKHRPSSEQASRGYEVVTNPNTQFRRAKCVIYHPNGILPRKNIEVANDALVFSEESFADQIFDSVTGYYSTFHSHLSKSTCLFLGLSLDDGGLKHILRQHVRNNPGNIHYFVHFVEDHHKLSKDYKKAVQDSNFEVYNLYTLFLNRSEYAALGSLITRDDGASLVRHCERGGLACRFVYYITGVPGSGKSTVTTALKCFHTIDEWMEERLAEMSKEHTKLTPRQRKKVDDWIREQFLAKNRALADMKEGISVVDRSPLDPFSFTEDTGLTAKARAFCETFKVDRVVAGQVVLLTGNFEEFARRIRALGKEGKSSYLQGLEKRMRRVLRANIRVINVDGLPRSHVTKNLLRLILFDEYKPQQLDTRIRNLANP